MKTSTTPPRRSQTIARCLLAGAVLFLGYNFLATQSAQRAGPFAYFKDQSGSGDAYDKGKLQVDEWVKNGSNAVAALQMLSNAGFTCHSILRPTRNPKYLTVPPTPISEKELSEGKFYNSRCRYTFGFFGEDWYAAFLSNDQQEIIRSWTGIKPVLDL